MRGPDCIQLEFQGPTCSDRACCSAARNSRELRWAELKVRSAYRRNQRGTLKRMMVV
jgi:hypothetical protein